MVKGGARRCGWSSAARRHLPCPHCKRCGPPVIAIELVLCQPDRPSGRGLALTVPPSKAGGARGGTRGAAAGEDPQQSRAAGAAGSRIRPDAIIVVAYGRLIPRWMLELPPLRQPEPARLAAAEVSRRRADPVGGGEWRDGDRRDDDAAGRGNGYGRHAAASRTVRSGRPILQRSFFRVWRSWVRR